MGPVLLLRLRAEARIRWRAWLGLAIVAGVVAGGIIAVVAGARRTETAYPRFLQSTRAFDVLMTNGGTTEFNANRQFDFAEIAALPQVADATRLNYYFPEGTVNGRRLAASDVTPFASPDGRFGTDLNRAHVLEGRLPRGQREVAVTFVGATRLGIAVGDFMQLNLSGPQAMAAAFGEDGDSAAPLPARGPERFRVVGLVAMQGGFPPLTGGIPPPILLSRDYARAHPDTSEVFALRLRGGRADIATFERTLQTLAGGEQVQATNQIELTSAVQRSLDVESTALRILAVLVAAVALLLLGQALARQAAADSRDHGVLRALGVTDSQLRSLGLARAAMVAVVAALLAVVTAVALSPLTPVGAARHAELHPGVDVNAAYVGAGSLAVFLALSFLGALSSWWSARSAKERAGLGAGSVSRFGSTLARAGFSVPAVSGARMALERDRSRSGVPVRSTILSVGLGVAAIAGVLSFAAGLGNLFHEPRLYGWNWDVQIGDAFAPDLLEQAEHLNRDPAVAAVSVGTVSRLQIGRLRVDTLAIEALRGTIEPTIVEGRAPSRPTEILLGTRTLEDVGASVGSVVSVGFGERTSRMRVVGRGVLTEFAGAARLGEGAALTLEGIRRVVPDAVPDVVLLRLRPGPASAALLRELTENPPANLYLPTKPSDLADLQRIGGLPSVVAGLLGLMAAVTMTHTLATSVRRRRRDLAILKVLGFVRQQVAATIAWQSTAVAAVAVVVGLPLGVAAGRWAWQLFSQRLGVPSAAPTPLLSMVILVPATIVLANLVAAVPARLAARTAPTSVLRTE